MTFNNKSLNPCAVYYNMNTFAKPQLKQLSQFTLADFSTLAEYVITENYTMMIENLSVEKLNLIDMLDLLNISIVASTENTTQADNLIRAGYSAVLQYLPRLTIIDYIKLLADSAAALSSSYNKDLPSLTAKQQSALLNLSNLIDKLTTETASKSLRIKQFEAEQRARLRARAERRASLAERELIKRRKQRAKQVQAQKTNLKMYIKALSVSTDEATFSQKVLKVAELIDSDLDLWFTLRSTCLTAFG